MKLLVLIILAAFVAEAQGVEVGVVAGAGTFSISSEGATSLGHAGAEVCVSCLRRFSLFGEYNHWFSSDASGLLFGRDRVYSADLAGAGLRFQIRRRIPVFFDTSVVGGQDRHDLMRGGGIGGIVVGAGVRIPIGGHF